jgi:hypothetical protein
MGFYDYLYTTGNRVSQRKAIAGKQWMEKQLNWQGQSEKGEAIFNWSNPEMEAIAN